MIPGWESRSHRFRVPLLIRMKLQLTRPLIFFDLETTGLCGGAGTLAFLVGCGRFADDGAFIIRQHLLADLGGERALLEAVGRDLAAAGSLVSFNGKSFDAPLLETRYLYHRLDWRRAGLPHLDILHLSRLFWGWDRRQTPEDRDCSLASLEKDVLGLARRDDLPGHLIPARYFAFVRSGDPRPLAAVLEHNRRDLMSLAGLSARVHELIAGGPAEAANPGEAFALGIVYSRAHLTSQAVGAFERALAVCDPASPSLRIRALHQLARTARRSRRHQDAALRWRELLDVPSCPAHLRREASEALAIHHEHRAIDLSAAKAFALGSLDAQARPAWNDAVQYRLARIQRKLERTEVQGLLAYLS